MYLSTKRIRQLEATISRLRSGMFSRDEEYTEKCGHTILLIKAHCSDNWHERSKQIIEHRLEREGY